jgi:hypothetical protein
MAGSTLALPFYFKMNIYKNAVDKYLKEIKGEIVS